MGSVAIRGIDRFSRAVWPGDADNQSLRVTLVSPASLIATIPNIDVALSTRLKPADTLAAVTLVSTLTSITNPVAVTGTFWQTTQPISIASMPSTPVTGTFFQATQPISGTVTGVIGKQSRSDTYTSTASGTTVDVSTNPTQYYAIQVKSTGSVASVWDMRLEGSLNNTDFSQILQHTNTTGDGVVLWTTTPTPAMYFRSRCAGITLGLATNIIVTILGRQ